MKNLLKLLTLAFLCQLSYLGFSQAVMDEHMLESRAEELKRREQYPDKMLNSLEAYRQIDYTSFWYQMIKASEMEDQYISNYIISLHVWDEPFEKLPEELRKQMTNPKNKEKIQQFLKHYLCIISEPFETFVDLAEVGNFKNLHGENINIKYQVGPIVEGKGGIRGRLQSLSTANNIEFGNNFMVKNGYCISLLDFLPGTLDYFK